MKANINFHIIRPVRIVAILGLLLFMAACKKEEKLTPTEKPEQGYKLPEGIDLKDPRIVDYYNRWGVYMLSKFTEQDFAWQVTGYDKKYKAVPADETYVGKQLDLLDNTFFKYYQDSTLRKYLPAKFFLCSSLTYVAKRADAYLLTSNDLGGFENFAVNWGNKRILNINSPIDSAAIFRCNVNFSFLKMMDIKKKMAQSDVFLATSDYTTPIAPTAPATFVTTGDRYKRGFLGTGGGVIPSSQVDWYAYLQIILSNTYANLTNPATTATDATAKGILSPIKDVNGVVKRKYDAMVKHYKEIYNIDIQKIGNGL
jgi:hypothetical protein